MKKTSIIGICVAVAMLAVLALGSFADAKERQVNDLIYGEAAQGEFLKQQRNGKCPDGTEFTTEIKGKTWCRKCPEGYSYDDTVKTCIKCPSGLTFVPNYERGSQTWGYWGICLDYRDMQ